MGDESRRGNAFEADDGAGGTGSSVAESLLHAARTAAKRKARMDRLTGVSD
jgi:hypothetical protein